MNYAFRNVVSQPSEQLVDSAILILVCAMKLNPALNLALAFLLQIRESPFQVVIWLDRLQLPHRPFQMH